MGWQLRPTQPPSFPFPFFTFPIPLNFYLSFFLHDIVAANNLIGLVLLYFGRYFVYFPLIIHPVT